MGSEKSFWVKVVTIETVDPNFLFAQSIALSISFIATVPDLEKNKNWIAFGKNQIFMELKKGGFGTQKSPDLLLYNAQMHFWSSKSHQKVRFRDAKIAGFATIQSSNCILGAQQVITK